MGSSLTSTLKIHITWWNLCSRKVGLLLYSDQKFLLVTIFCYCWNFLLDVLGIETISKEEWIVFRSKSYKFEEFLQQWQERLQSGIETTSLTVRLLQEVEKYKVSTVHSIVIDYKCSANNPLTCVVDDDVNSRIFFYLMLYFYDWFMCGIFRFLPLSLWCCIIMENVFDILEIEG